MPTIDEVVKKNISRRATLGPGADLNPTPAAPPPSPRSLEAPPSVRSLLPSRGALPPNLVLEVDLNEEIAGRRFRSRVFRGGGINPTVKVSPVSAQENAQVVKVPAGAPQQVTNLVVTALPTKLNGQFVALVTATWLPTLTDRFYS